MLVSSETLKVRRPSGPYQRLKLAMLSTDTKQQGAIHGSELTNDQQGMDGRSDGGCGCMRLPRMTLKSRNDQVNTYILHLVVGRPDMHFVSLIRYSLVIIL